MSWGGWDPCQHEMEENRKMDEYAQRRKDDGRRTLAKGFPLDIKQRWSDENDWHWRKITRIYWTNCAPSEERIRYIGRFSHRDGGDCSVAAFRAWIRKHAALCQEVVDARG